MGGILLTIEHTFGTVCMPRSLGPYLPRSLGL
jgi:hypothetical protein